MGSYKLYVLVSYAIERHLELGGNDRPSEILLSFFYRYGQEPERYPRRKRRKLQNSNTCFFQQHQQQQLLKTILSQDVAINCSESNATADLSNVFQLQELVEVFHACYNILSKKISKMLPKAQARGFFQYTPLLGELIDVSHLSRERQQMLLRNAISSHQQEAASSKAVINAAKKNKNRRHNSLLPWWCTEDNAASPQVAAKVVPASPTTAGTTTAIIRHLPTFGIPSRLLDRIDDELIAFANYVQIQSAEMCARNLIIRSLLRTAREAFPDSPEKVQLIQASSGFPSASSVHQLCTFGCILELILTGVSLTNEAANAAAGFGRNSSTGATTTTTTNKKKEERMNRWREALARADSFSGYGGGTTSNAEDDAHNIDSDSDDDTADKLTPLLSQRELPNADASYFRGSSSSDDDDDPVNQLDFLLDGQFDDASGHDDDDGYESDDSSTNSDTMEVNVISPITSSVSSAAAAFTAAKSSSTSAEVRRARHHEQQIKHDAQTLNKLRQQLIVNKDLDSEPSGLWQEAKVVVTSTNSMPILSIKTTAGVSIKIRTALVPQEDNKGHGDNRNDNEEDSSWVIEQMRKYKW